MISSDDIHSENLCIGLILTIYKHNNQSSCTRFAASMHITALMLVASVQLCVRHHLYNSEQKLQLYTITVQSQRAYKSLTRLLYITHNNAIPAKNNADFQSRFCQLSAKYKSQLRAVHNRQRVISKEQLVISKQRHKAGYAK